MQIIVVDRRLARARTVDLNTGTLVGVGIVALTVVALAVVALYLLTFRLAAEVKLPLVRDLIGWVLRDELARNEQFVRDNVSALARRVGEMQAQLMRLDALGERIAKLAGIRPEEFNFKELPGRGGSAPSGGRPLTLEELQSELERVQRGVASRQDYLDVIESELLAAQVRRALLPQNAPVVEGFVGSGFGMRTDPFTGQLAMHAGVDFAAPAGTPIYAAAGGVVASAEEHPFYGKTVTIDHGNDLSTLYAHASRILVKPGDIVRRGQKIAEVGASGRATGPHLHFEVHVRGQPQNPAKFLLSQKGDSPLAALTANPSTRKTAVESMARVAPPAPRIDLQGLVERAQAASAARGAE
ncbi:MAG: M23 family metallopeptidase [Sutterellaceae bacterium]|nr:M23 family metallopeptidase [Burkholderiaceae bacterium]MCX7901911.1 M23 family metallopeptidase [Burkholderiaceae bacterium]MDW8429374.1 M23 family metallopeptidase [Sutterellaceae bacterium]